MTELSYPVADIGVTEAWQPHSRSLECCQVKNNVPARGTTRVPWESMIGRPENAPLTVTIHLVGRASPFWLIYGWHD